MPFIELLYYNKKGAVYAKTNKMQKSLPFSQCFRISSGSQHQDQQCGDHKDDLFYCSQCVHDFFVDFHALYSSQKICCCFSEFGADSRQMECNGYHM